MSRGPSRTGGGAPFAQADLASEIQQRRGFRNPAQEALLAIQRTGHLLNYRIEAITREADITHQQYNILRILRGADEPMPIMEIGQRLVQPTPGITRLIQRLEQRGLLRRQADSVDRRVQRCAITDDGLELLCRLQPCIEAFEDRMAALMDDQGWRRLADDCSRIRACLHTASR